MIRHLVRGLLAGLCVLAWVSWAPAEPAQSRFPPPPREVKPRKKAKPRVIVYYSYPRVSHYEVWQNTGVGWQGRFRPVVVVTPYGPYYRYNGEPFPWLLSSPWEVTPTVMGTPYRSR